MKTLLNAMIAYLAGLAGQLASGWGRFWFSPSAPTTLGMMRVCTGLILFYVHITTFHQLLDFVGARAWIDDTAIAQIAGFGDSVKQRLDAGQIPYDHETNPKDLIHINTWYRLSLWELVRDPFAIQLIHGVFVGAMFCMAIGLFTRVAVPLAWFGHLSYIHRGYSIWFGMDSMLLFISFYLMFAPCGWALSVDRLLARWRAIRRPGLGKEALGEAPPVAWHWSATTLTRMVQIHMSIVYLCAGVAKLQGPTWWNGYATWMTMNTAEFALVDMRWLGQLPFAVWNTVTTFTTYATLAFELAFIFLIWFPFWRPILLFSAVGLHLGIGFFMGLVAFGNIMLTGCMSFIPPESMQWFLNALFGGPQSLTFRFSRQDAAGLKQATLLKTMDVWGRIAFAEDATQSGGGTLELPSGKTARGKGALLAATPRLAALWLAWPFLLIIFPGGK